MAITNFIPEVWAAAIAESLKKSLVYGNVSNRDYEGDIAQKGDTVHITGVQDLTIGDYVKGTDITVEAATDRNAATLTIDQAKYFAFEADDVDKRQAAGDFVTAFSTQAAYQLADVADQYIAGVMAGAAANKLADVATTEPEKAYDTLVDLAVALDKSNTPTIGRWVVVTPEFYGLLRKDTRFVAGSENANATLLNGQIGTAAGFAVLESNNAPAANSKTTKAAAGDLGNVIIAGSPVATTFAEQINSVEAARKEKGFADVIKGLHLYGATVVRPDALAVVNFKVGA